jgi:hypothetical protein
MSVAAALRAALYWYATTGEVPPGFEEKLPAIAAHAPFTAVRLEEVVARGR